MSARLELRNVSKAFGDNWALRDVSLDIEDGEVHALLGENGAGKSTLMKILSGVYKRTEGTIAVSGRELALRSPAEALAEGIGTVHQEFDLLPELDVADNVLVGRERTRGAGRLPFCVRSRRDTRRACAELIERHGMSRFLRSEDRVADLPTEGQQLVQILKVLVAKPRMVIFDEPSARLSAPARARLFEIITALRADGLPIVYISHHLEEVFELSDMITVLRDGAVVATRPTGDLDATELSAMMLGPARTGDGAGSGAGAEHRPPPGRNLLEARNVRVKDSPLTDVSLTVAAGEIVGVTGLVGSGRHELLRGIAGLLPVDGDVRMDREGQRHESRPQIGRDIGFVPGDRRREGLCLEHSVRTNMALGFLRDQRRWGVIADRATRGAAEHLRHRVRLVCGSLDQPVWQLSGGNQQKVLLARWLGSQAPVIILESPTTGVDVGAKAEIHGLIRELASEGRGVVISSDDIPELQSLCDRVVLVDRGRVAREWDRETFDHEKLVSYLMEAST